MLPVFRAKKRATQNTMLPNESRSCACRHGAMRSPHAGIRFGVLSLGGLRLDVAADRMNAELPTGG
ncbi:MAG: hypothetical protein DME74_05495 [Verrucomicrobia bacterium]|nr:MAG: hypothetical protein DME74_05495 [Verrucomicrobiota bacterium]